MATRHRALTALLLPALLAAAPAPATGPASMPAPATMPATRPAAPPEVAALLGQLGSPDWPQRERAQRDLIKRGPSVRPFVEQRLADAADPEVHSRAAAVLRALDREAMFGQSLVTLHYDKADPKTVLDDLAKQAGTHFQYWPPPDPWVQMQQGTEESKRVRVTADLTGVPFWRALDEVAPQAGVQAMVNSPRGNGRPSLQWVGPDANPNRRGSPDSPTVYSGPFMVRATSANYQLFRTTNFGGEARSGRESMSIQLQAFAEPKLHVLTASQVPRLTEATDAAGNSLIAAGQNRNEYFAEIQGWSWNVALQLEPDAAARAAGAGGDDSRVLKTLRGTLAITVATGSRTLTIPDLPTAAGKTFDVGTYKVKVVRAEEADSINKDGTPTRRRRNQPAGAARPVVYAVTLLVSGNGPTGVPASQEADLRRSLQAVEILDAQGRPLNEDNTNFDVLDRELQVVLRVSAGPAASAAAGGEVGPPQTLVWTYPTGSEPMEVPFEFHDLPLP